jgi:signal transduction histidine kinase
VQSNYIALIFFLYGLAFFSMGLLIVQEVGRCTDARLRLALRFLAAFGLLHGTHEWVEMFRSLSVFTVQPEMILPWETLRLFILAFSFLPLGTFGAILISSHEENRRLALLFPLALAGIWSIGLLVLRGYYGLQDGLLSVIEVWTRYSLAIPCALLACLGLVIQQRTFRRSGLAQFGQDSLWAAIAFAWYGLVGQIFTNPSPLPPSNIINSELFSRAFGFPIQLMRAIAALVAAFFVIRFLRAFEVEIQRKMEQLRVERLEESQRREALRGELLMRVVTAQEAERQRIARELHDETGQALTALGLGLRGASTAVKQDPEKAVQNLRQLESLTAHSLVELQRLIADLRPSHLDDLGLPAALRWYGGEVEKRSQIKTKMEVTGEPQDIPLQVKTALFRVAQEALTNVVKHANAQTALIRLNFQPDVVILEVQDDGCGFDQELVNRSQRASWGLAGMEERASLLGGSVSVNSQVGQGTLVRVIIPYHHVEGVRDDNPSAIGG